MRRHTIVVLLALFYAGCHGVPDSESTPESASAVHSEAAVSDACSGLERPGLEPRLLMPQILRQDQIEHGGVFSPDLSFFYFTASDPQYQQFTVYSMQRRGDGWSAPRAASFSGTHSDHAVYFPPGGDQLWFSSTRPRYEGEEDPTWRLWSLRSHGEDLGEAVWIRIPSIETRWQSHATSTADGVLYFHALKSGSTQGGGMDFDLYRALPTTPTHEESGLSPPLRLGPEINTTGVEVTAWVAADESHLLFAAYGRADGYGHGDLYISHRSTDGHWQTARNLGPQINSEFEESNPSLTPDGKYLIFSSSRPLPDGQGGQKGLHLYWVLINVPGEPFE